MRAMERRGRRGEDGREEEGREGKGERRDRGGRAVEGNRDTVLAVSHAITRTINSLRIILYVNISSEI